MITIDTAWGVYDTHGVADALVLDADGDTTISAPTDDQIDVEIGGSDVGTLTASSWAIDADIDVSATAGNELIVGTDGAGHITSMRSPADDQLYYKVNDVDMFKLDQSGTIGFQIENNNSKLMSIDYTGVGYVFQIGNYGAQFLIRPRTDGNAFQIKDSASLNVLLVNTNNNGGIPFDMTLGVNDQGRFIVQTFDNDAAEDKEGIQVRAYNDGAYRLLCGVKETTVPRAWIQAYQASTGAADLSLNELGGNVIINGTTTGSSADGVLCIHNGTQGAALANAIQLCSEDLSAGNTTLSIRAEGSGIFASGTPASASGAIALKVNGTTYYLTASTSAPT